MIYLQRDSSNQVVLTLKEKATLASPFYLFSFVPDDTNEAKLFTAPDVSTSTSRYNQFEITVTGGTENLLNGTINIEPNGFGKYTCYEMTGSTNLDISGTTSIVETGKFLISGTTLPVITEYNGQSNIKYTYNG